VAAQTDNKAEVSSLPGSITV